MPKILILRNTIVPVEDADPLDLDARSAAVGEIRDVSKAMAQILIDAKKARLATDKDRKPDLPKTSPK